MFPPQGVNVGEGDYDTLTTDELRNGIAGQGNSVTDVEGFFWNTIATHTDTDVGTALDHTFSSLGDYATHRLVYVGESGGQLSPEIRCQVSGYTSAYYAQSFIGNGSSSTSSENTYWTLSNFVNRPSELTWKLKTDYSFGDGRFDRPTIGLDSISGLQARSVLFQGSVQSDTPFPVTSIRVFADSNATGRVYLQGRVEQ